MKKLIVIAAALALIACTKENVPTVKTAEDIKYTNTITVNDQVLEMVQFEFEVDEEEGVVAIYGTGLKQIGESKTEVINEVTKTTTDYNAAGFEIEIPLVDIGQFINLNSAPFTKNKIYFVTTVCTKVEAEFGDCNVSRGFEPGELTYCGQPKFVTYYFNEYAQVKLSEYHSGLFHFYFHFTDVNGNTYTVSYQGPEFELDY